MINNKKVIKLYDYVLSNFDNIILNKTIIYDNNKFLINNRYSKTIYINSHYTNNEYKSLGCVIVKKNGINNYEIMEELYSYIKYNLNNLKGKFKFKNMILTIKKSDNILFIKHKNSDKIFKKIYITDDICYYDDEFNNRIKLS